MPQTGIGAIVQARMSASRLPGKVLHRVAGKPLLEYLLERLDRSREIELVVVATSVDKSDDPVAEFCDRKHRNCVRGPLEDVSGRFVVALDQHGFEGFVRVNGDSPLLDPQLIDRGVRLFQSGRVDLVTNIYPRTYPPGESVEVIRSRTFQKAYPRMVEEGRTEHVTQHFYANPDDYTISNFTADTNWEGVHLAVDTPQDLITFRSMVAHMERPHWEYGLDEIMHLYRLVIGGGAATAP